MSRHFFIAGAAAASLMASVLGVGLNTGIAAAAPGAQKVPLSTTNRDCQGNVVGGTGTGPGSGFAIINETGDGNLIGNVVLQRALPNTTYNVRLIQTPSGSDCGVIDGTITTDADGYGQVNVQEPVLQGTHDAFVAVNQTSNPDTNYLTTPDVSF